MEQYFLALIRGTISYAYDTITQKFFSWKEEIVRSGSECGSLKMNQATLPQDIEAQLAVSLQLLGVLPADE